MSDPGMEGVPSSKPVPSSEPEPKHAASDPGLEGMSYKQARRTREFWAGYQGIRNN